MKFGSMVTIFAYFLGCKDTNNFLNLQMFWSIIANNRGDRYGLS